MIEKSDWDAAFRELIAKRSRSPGELPREDDLLAYSLGELSSEEASRVEKALAAHPDLLRALREPFPEGPRAGDPAPLTNQEKEEDWAKIQARLAGRVESAPEQPTAPPVVLPFVVPATQTSKSLPLQPHRFSRRLWKISAAAAAVLAIIFCGLYFQMRTEVQRLSRELGSPRVPEHRILLPDGVRGGKQPAVLLPSTPDSFLLAPSLIDQPDYPEYRLAIVQEIGNERKTIWSASGLQRQSDDTVEIWVPRAFLKPGKYQLQLFGAEGEKLLATYTVQLAD